MVLDLALQPLQAVHVRPEAEPVVAVVLEERDHLRDAWRKAGVDLVAVQEAPVLDDLRRRHQHDADLLAEASESGAGGSAAPGAGEVGRAPRAGARPRRPVRPEELADPPHPRFDRMVHRIAGDVPAVREHRFADPRVQVPLVRQAGQLRQPRLLGGDLLVLGDGRERVLPHPQQSTLVVPCSRAWLRAASDQSGEVAGFG